MDFLDLRCVDFRCLCGLFDLGFFRLRWLVSFYFYWFGFEVGEVPELRFVSVFFCDNFIICCLMWGLDFILVWCVRELTVLVGVCCWGFVD